MNIRCIIIVCATLLLGFPGMAEDEMLVTPQNPAMTTTSSRNVQSQTDQGNATDQTGATIEQTQYVTGAETSAEQNNEGFSGIEAESSDATPNESRPSLSNEDDALAENASNEKGNGMNLLSALLSLLALGFSGYVLFISSKHCGRKKLDNRNESQADSNVKDLLQQNQDIRLSLNSLSRRFDELERNVMSLSVNNQADKQQVYQQNQNTRSGDSASSAVIRYAAIVTSDGFPDENLADSNTDYTIAILSLIGNTGTYVINNLPSAQSFLISNFAYSIGRICEVKQQNDAAQKVETVNPGRISRQGNIWTIVSKADVKLV